MDIQHIFCVGRNFAKHVAEMGSETPAEPMIFTKPSYSLAKADGKTLSYPSDRGAVHYEMEIVLYIGKPVIADFAAEDVVTKMALGMDMTLRDIQSDLKKKGHPWLLAKGFSHAAVLTDFWDFPGRKECDRTNFSLLKNGNCVQSGDTRSLIFDFQTLLTYIYRHVGLAQGDIIYTGTPEGVGPIADKDTFVLQWGKEEKGRFTVAM